MANEQQEWLNRSGSTIGDGWAQERLLRGDDNRSSWFLNLREMFMSFTIQPELLIRLIQMLGETHESLKRPHSEIRLLASRNRVWVRKGQHAAESEAIVRTEGQCTLSCRRLMHALKACRNEVTATLQADQRQLCVGGVRLPVVSYSSCVPVWEDFEVFMASEIGFVSPEPAVRAA
jgi:hypothetical protein